MSSQNITDLAVLNETHSIPIENADHSEDLVRPTIYDSYQIPTNLGPSMIIEEEEESKKKIRRKRKRNP